MKRWVVCCIACVLLGGSVASAQPAPSTPLPDVNVSMTEYQYTPARVDAEIGQAVMFNNDGTVQHGMRVRTGQGKSSLYSSPGFGGGFTPTVAGSFPFRCYFHPDQMDGVLRVPPSLDVTSGPPGTVFNLTWSWNPFYLGTKMQVEMRKDGGSWAKAGGGNGTGIALTPTDPGTYDARVRPVDPEGVWGQGTKWVPRWSPPVTFTVT